ncbi:hypothetical protein HYV82_03545 [Candidatus Woesearchaeota archaeon]|nr:hypothetical protein [Candidatus Woesearchaeota archaeon]
MMKTGKKRARVLIAAVMAVMIAVLASFASAQLGEQSFAKLNFTDSTLTDAEIDSAETAFSDPGLLPGHPLYFLKAAKEKVQLLVEFDREKKASLHLRMAGKRLAEARALADRNMTGKAKESVMRFESEVELSDEGNGSVRERQEMLGKSGIMLQLLLDRLPEEAKPAIEKALNRSIETKVRIEIKEDARDDREKSRLLIKERVRDEQKKLKEIRSGLSERREKAEEAIRDADESLAELRAKLAANATNATNATTGAEIEKLLFLAEEKIASARTALNNSKFGEAYGQANAARQLVKNAERRLERGLERGEEKKEEKEEREEEKEEDEETGIDAEKKIRISDSVTKTTNRTAKAEIKIREKVKEEAENKTQAEKKTEIKIREKKEIKVADSVPIPSLP